MYSPLSLFNHVATIFFTNPREYSITRAERPSGLTFHVIFLSRVEEEGPGRAFGFLLYFYAFCYIAALCYRGPSSVDLFVSIVRHRSVDGAGPSMSSDKYLLFAPHSV